MLSAEDRAPLRVVVADDHELVRTALESVIEAEDDMVFVGGAADGTEAVEMAELLRPDILLLDLRMPGMDGVEVCRAVMSARPQTKVVILTGFDDAADAQDALAAGAVGYLFKDVHPRALVDALRGVGNGQTVLDPDVASVLIPRAAETPAGAPVRIAEALTARELQVLSLMARGMKNAEIATDLWLAPSTVKSHVSRIIAKLGQADRTQAVLAGIRLGLVDVTREP